MVAATLTDQITFWNDFLLKSQFTALSSSISTMKQHQHQQKSDQIGKGQSLEKSVLDRLPDEILIHVLSQPLIDFNTLGHILDVSQRMRELSLYVLSQYRLPAIQLAISIDQEGRNRITSKFSFDQLDHASLSISMKCLLNTPRRYYSNKASPIIRSITVKDKYIQELSSHSRSVRSAATCMSLQDCFADDIDSFSFKIKNEECSSITASSSSSTAERQHHQISETALVSPQHPIAAATTTDNNNGRLNRKIHTRKEGLHTLQVPQNSSILHNKRSLVSWKFDYQISKQQQRHECHLSPLNITIQLDQLLLLIEKSDNGKDQQPKQSQDSKKWGSRMMGWVMNHCNS